MNLELATANFERAVNSISIAVMRNDIERVKNLCAIVHATFDSSDEKYWARLCTEPLESAADYGRSECMKIVLPFSWVTKTDALQKAAVEGHLDCVKMLVPYYEQTVIDQALLGAMQHGKFPVVYFLINHTPTFLEKTAEHALVLASTFKDIEAVEYFYTQCNPNTILNTPPHNKKWTKYTNQPNFDMLETYHSAAAQRARIEQEVGNATATNKRKAKI